MARNPRDTAVRVWRFFARGIWEIREKELSPLKGAALRVLRVPVLAVDGFRKDQCMNRAQVLTFYTILSIVPVLALALGVGKGFGLDEVVEKQIYELFKGQTEVADRIVEFSLNMLQSVKGSVIAGTGLAILFWSAFRLFWNMEKAFNAIFGFKGTRPIPRMFIDYLAAAVFTAILWLGSSTAVVVAAARVQEMTAKVEVVQPLSPLIYSSLRVAPYAVIWFMLCFIYLYLPYGRVRWKSAVIASVVAGTIYMLFQWLYIGAQVGVTRINAVYGSFAAIPLLLMWLQFSFAIVLFGAEVAYAHMHARTHLFESEFVDLSLRMKKVLAITMAARAADRFDKGLSPETADEMSEILDLPYRPVHSLLEMLVRARVLSEVVGDAGEGTVAFQPAMNTEKMTLGSVSRAIEKEGTDYFPGLDSPVFHAAEERLKDLDQVMARAPENGKLAELAAGLPHKELDPGPETVK